VLQHGTLLLETPLHVAATAAHPGLFDLYPAAAAAGVRDLASTWLDRVAEAAGLRGEIAAEEFRPLHAAAITAAAERFADPAWLERR
jgi:hypothetical protein